MIDHRAVGLTVAEIRDLTDADVRVASIRASLRAVRSRINDVRQDEHLAGLPSDVQPFVVPADLAADLERLEEEEAIARADRAVLGRRVRTALRDRPR